MPDPKNRQKGLEAFAKVMGFEAPDPGGDAFLEATVDHLFAEVWADPGLSVRDRRLVTLTVLAQLGNESVLRIHAGAALKSGDLSDAEMDALVLHLAHYAGWPPAAILATTLHAIRSERR